MSKAPRGHEVSFSWMVLSHPSCQPDCPNISEPLSPCSRLERQENEAEPDMASFVKKRLRGSPDRTLQITVLGDALIASESLVGTSEPH